MISIGLKIVLSIFTGLIFFCLMTERALVEDVLIYYTEFSLDYISIDSFIRLYNSVLDGGEKISSFRVNFLAHFLYSSLSNFNFNVFIVLNIAILALIYFIIFDKYLLHLSRYKYLLIFSIQNYLHFAYTWRQALALLLGILIFYNYKKQFKMSKLAFISIFIHPVSIFFIVLQLVLNNKFFRNLSLLNILIVCSIFYVFNTKSSIGQNTFEIVTAFETTNLKWIAVLIFSTLPVLACWRTYNKESKNIFLFIGTFCCLTILFISDEVFFSRLLAAMIILIQLTHLMQTKKYFKYIVSGNLTIFTYFLLNVEGLWLFSTTNY